MPRRKRREKGKPWLRELVNGTLRWYYPYALTGGKGEPIRRPDGSFIDGKDAEEEAIQLWHELMAKRQARIWNAGGDLKVVLSELVEDLESWAQQLRTILEPHAGKSAHQEQ
jgi:hypothetical protein